MSHYDCKDCGERPQACECAKARKAERQAYWTAEALKRRQALNRIKTLLPRCGSDAIPEEGMDDALALVISMASAKVAEAEKFAKAAH